ncbi:MAG TPA: hypothetical protein PLE28_02720 [bacterium]|nr:hypothetical protein [bacterium]
MGSFNRGDRSGRRSSFGGDRGRGRDRSSRPEMHEAICADCGQRCEVPFRPSSDKPVYCSNCFEKRDSGRRSDNRNSDRRSFDRRDKSMVKVVCDNCHKECEVPFKPSGDKPVYCDDCFNKVGRSNKNDRSNHNNVNEVEIEQYRKHFSVLDSKLDEILKMLSSITKPTNIKPIVPVEKKDKAKKIIKLAKNTKTLPKKVETKKNIKKVVKKK